MQRLILAILSVLRSHWPVLTVATSFNKKTWHRTAESLVANVETARPNGAAVATASSRSACESANSMLQDNQKGGGGDFDYC